jgi:hypothetical protein
MVQRKNNNNDSGNYFASIIQWIHNNPKDIATSDQQQPHQEYNNKTNPRQQLLFARHLKRSRHRTCLTLPEFEQEEVVTTTNNEKLS